MYAVAQVFHKVISRGSIALAYKVGDYKLCFRVYPDEYVLVANASGTFVYADSRLLFEYVSSYFVYLNLLCLDILYPGV
jgi:hypothetical protein